MILSEKLADLKSRYRISETQETVLLELAAEKTISLYWEIRALYYVGVMTMVLGVAWVSKEYVAKLGPLGMVAALSAGFMACFVYCFSKKTAYSPEAVTSPTLAFDYILYLGCALFSLALGVLENQFHLLKNQWDLYLLGSSLLFFVLAYRFDNRLVLSLALTSLAGWCGIKVKAFGFYESDLLYPTALAYGGTMGFIGFFLSRTGIKKHFLDIYLNFAANVLFITLVAGTIHSHHETLYFLGLLLLCTAAIFYSLRVRRFIYFVYALVYGYIGVSSEIVPHIHGTGPAFIYFIVSSLTVITAIFIASRRFREDE